MISYFVDGEQWETETETLGHPAGDSVLVVYDAGDPSSAYIQGDPDYEEGHLLASFFAADDYLSVFFVAALFFLSGVLLLGILFWLDEEHVRRSSSSSAS